MKNLRRALFLISRRLWQVAGILYVQQQYIRRTCSRRMPYYIRRSGSSTFHHTSVVRRTHLVHIIVHVLRLVVQASPWCVPGRKGEGLPSVFVGEIPRSCPKSTTAGILGPEEVRYPTCDNTAAAAVVFTGHENKFGDHAWRRISCCDYSPA